MNEDPRFKPEKLQTFIKELSSQDREFLNLYSKLLFALKGLVPKTNCLEQDAMELFLYKGIHSEKVSGVNYIDPKEIKNGAWIYTLDQIMQTFLYLQKYVFCLSLEEFPDPETYHLYDPLIGNEEKFWYLFIFKANELNTTIVPVNENKFKGFFLLANGDIKIPDFILENLAERSRINFKEKMVKVFFE